MLKLFACRQKSCVIVTDVKQDGRLIPQTLEGLIREKSNWQRVFQTKRISNQIEKEETKIKNKCVESRNMNLGRKRA